MTQKANRPELKDLESYFLGRMEDLINGFETTFAPKVPTSDGLNQLDMKIQSLFELLQASKKEGEGDAMFMKKPL